MTGLGVAGAYGFGHSMYLIKSEIQLYNKNITKLENFNTDINKWQMGFDEKNIEFSNFKCSEI